MNELDADLSLTATERETGVSREVLRKWELRYGFPNPTRSAKGERRYPLDQVERIKLIKRLMDGGWRPAKLASMDSEALARLSAGSLNESNVGEGYSASIVRLLARHDITELRKALKLALAERGLCSFVQDIIAPANHAVGAAWFRNILRVHEEHLYSAVVQEVLGEAISHLTRDGESPRVLLATPPNELHGLGILMVQALFTLHGANCISLGTQTPLLELRAAASAYQVDIVALSFSVAYPARRIAPFLAELRASLEPGTEIWIGGEGTRGVKKLPAGVVRFLSLAPALEALSKWRAARTGSVQDMAPAEADA